jgi:hypothetical protein
VGEADPDVIEKPVGSPHGAESIECTGVEDYFVWLSSLALYPTSYPFLVFQVFFSEFTFEVLLFAENDTSLKTKKKHRKQEDQPQ